MRKKLLLLAAVIGSLTAFSQDFSNKGRDFWVGYGNHCDMYNANGTVNATGGAQDMVLYFATEAVTNVTVSIPNIGYTQTYSNIGANTIFETPAIPKSGASDARLSAEGIFNKGIHIVSDQPIVAYAHIYNGARSGATLLFPTNTLGKEYYSLNMTQNSQQAYSYCYFFVVATDTGTTTIQVTPSANTQTMNLGVTYTYNLTQGQVFNALGTIAGNSGVDLTGSKVISIASGTGNCKPIAVFSGSGKINLSCPINAGGSADNYIVQSFPKTAWGKNYLTVPTAGMPYNYFRIAVSDPTAVVKLNGTTMSGLINNFYYQIAATNQPNSIQSDKPIMVAQYITTSGACGNNVGIPVNEGDPEVIYLSSIEQNISRVLIYSTPHYQINEHFISVLVPNGGTGVSSFRLDGAVPSSPFVVHPQNSNYSYLQQPVTGAMTHTLQSDSGFNAQAYGYGNVESYGYNAGTNIKDLLTFITPINPLNISTNVTACTGTPFYFSVTLPKAPDSLTYLTWDFHNNPPGSPYPNVTQTAPLIPDATYFIGATQVWRYKLPGLYSYSPAGVYPITITAGTVTAEGCGNSFIIDRDLYVYDPPIPGFNWTNNGCVTDSVAFNDTTSYAPGTYPYIWRWDFGDGTFSTVKSPHHLYATAGTYTVTYTATTNVGCQSDTASRTIIVTNVPVPKFGVSSPRCDGFPVTFSDSSTLVAPGALVKWYWDFGDGLKDTLSSGINRVHTYTPWGGKIATLKVETNSGCKSAFYRDSLYVGPIPFVNFNLPAGICMPADSAHFFDASTIADGSGSGFAYKWHFGDPPSGVNDSSILKNPAHYYNNTGPFSINLRVTSNVGCVHDTTKVLSNIFSQPHANFTVNPENCLRDSTAFTSNATGSGSNIVEWHWDFGDSGFSTLQNPKHLYATIGIKTIKHWIVTDKGCYSDTTTHTVLINALPTANFTNTAPSCETKVISFTDASAPNAGTLNSWHWDFDDPASGANNTSPLQNPTHTFASWGTYSVKLVAGSDKGCFSDTFTRQVIIHPQPIPGFISPEVCLSDAFAQFIDTSKIANGWIQTWLWNFGDPGSGPFDTSSLQNPVHRFNAIGFYTTKLVVTSNIGCVDSILQTFTVNGDIPVANFNALNPANLCANDSVAIKDASTVNFGNITKLEIYWDNVGAPLVFQTEDNPYPGIIIKHLYPNFQSPPTKTYDIRYRAYSGATCVNDKIKTIVINAAPKVQFNPIPPICLDAAPYQVTQASEVGGVPGTFEYSGPGVSPTGLFNPAVAGAGTHTILYTYTSNTGSCVDTASQTILVWDPPVADFRFSTPACETVPITFADTSTNTVGTLTTWTWDFGDGTPVQVRNNNLPFTHTFLTWGTYNVTLKVNTSNGCNSTVKLIPVVVKPQPKPDFTIPASVCLPNAFVVFNNTSMIDDGTQNAFTYLWDFGDPPSGIANNSTLKNPSHTYVTTGPFNVNLQVTSGAGCVLAKTIVLNTVHPRPNADFTPDKLSTCIGGTITFTDNSQPLDGTVSQWYWNYGDGVVDSGSAVVRHAYPDTLTYNASLYIVNSNGCRSDTMTRSFTVYPYPVVSAGPDKNVLDGGSVILEAVATGNDLQYLWIPNLYLDNDTIVRPKGSDLLDDVTYILTVTARGGCQASDNVFVKLLKAPRIPNTFTPNGDRTNNTWIIQYLESYPNNRVQVFTRTGQLVFESHGYMTPWDGTYRGKPLPVDTYYYIIEPNNGRAPITGYVTIIR